MKNYAASTQIANSCYTYINFLFGDIKGSLKSYSLHFLWLLPALVAANWSFLATRLMSGTRRVLAILRLVANILLATRRLNLYVISSTESEVSKIAPVERRRERRSRTFNWRRENASTHQLECELKRSHQTMVSIAAADTHEDCAYLIGHKQTKRNEKLKQSFRCIFLLLLLLGCSRNSHFNNIFSRKAAQSLIDAERACH